uniref:Uncharacterized protein n=1 Tax=Leersia perrieri TaxID=77586 RepID=A0A0D9XTN8_9ORYZ
MPALRLLAAVAGGGCGCILVCEACLHLRLLAVVAGGGCGYILPRRARPASSLPSPAAAPPHS